MDLIKKYEVRIWSGRDFEAPDQAFRIMIVLYGEGDEIIAYLRFWEGSIFRDNFTGEGPAGGVEGSPYEFNYPYHCYMPIVDLLRNEKPMYLSYLMGDLPSGMLSTAKEQVGEGESRKSFLRRR